MEVIEAKSAGFCYGVKRAVQLAEETGKTRDNCVMLGYIIHNSHVMRRLAELGVGEIDSTEALQGGETVIIRSHGEAKRIFDEIEAKGACCVNATCPNVLRIQKLVQQAEEEGRLPIIIGDPDHPEVQGIAGWTGTARIFRGEEELALWLSENGENAQMPCTVVAQTTSIRKNWESSLKIIKKECTNAKIFDTICDATQKRQSEAAEIAARVDAMVVVGDSRSANTRHLAEICQQVCPLVFRVEGADELPMEQLSGCRVVGLTAGASTPAGIIKEVKNKMTEEIKVAEGMEESFAELLEKSIKTLNSGEKVTGIVTDINSTEVIVDLGTKQPGYIKVEELSADPDVKPEDIVKVGDEIEAYVIRVSDIDGVAMLSKKRLDAAKVWDVIEEYANDKTVVEGTVSEVNKGGIVVNVKGVRVFVPASQSGMPKDSDLSTMIKEKVSLRITEVNRARRRVVGSIRAVQQEARQAAQAAIWETIAEGNRYTSTVKSITSYGVFVDIGGVDGMVHISELSWSRIKHPSEIVKVGDTLEVYVIAADKEKRKISLGVKDKSMEPWTMFMNQYKVGDVANVKIVKLMQFGAFAEVVPGVDGLIHISQIADRRIEKPADVLSEGQMVDAMITAVDEENRKISLSIRALLAPAAEEAAEEAAE